MSKLPTWPPGPKGAPTKEQIRQVLFEQPHLSNVKIAEMTGSSQGYVSIVRSELHWEGVRATENQAAKVCALDLHHLFMATNERLDTLMVRAKEGQGLLAASEFANWINNSALVSLLKKNPALKPFEVDGNLIRQKTDDLLWCCHKDGKAMAAAQAGTSSLNERMARIEALLSQKAA